MDTPLGKAFKNEAREKCEGEIARISTQVVYLLMLQEILITAIHMCEHQTFQDMFSLAIMH